MSKIRIGILLTSLVGILGCADSGSPDPTADPMLSIVFEPTRTSEGPVLLAQARVLNQGSAPALYSGCRSDIPALRFLDANGDPLNLLNPCGPLATPCQTGDWELAPAQEQVAFRHVGGYTYSQTDCTPVSMPPGTYRVEATFAFAGSDGAQQTVQHTETFTWPPEIP